MAYANVPEHVAAQRGEIINRHKQLAAKHAAAPEAQKQGIKRDMDVLHDRHERLMQPYQVKQAKAADLATEARSNGRGTGAPIGGGKVGKVNIDNAVEVEGEKEKVRNAGRAAANGGVVGAAQIRANIAAAGGEKATSAPPISETPASSAPAPKAKAVKKASPESKSGPVTVTKVASNETKAAAPAPVAAPAASAPVAAPAASAPAPSRAAAVPAEGTPSGKAPKLQRIGSPFAGRSTPTSQSVPLNAAGTKNAVLKQGSPVPASLGGPKKPRKGKEAPAAATPVEQGPVTAAPPASVGPSDRERPGPNPASPAPTPAPKAEAKPEAPRRMPAAPVAPAASNPTGRERSAPVATPAAPAAPRTTTSPTSPSAAPSSPAPTPARVAPAQATTLNPSQTSKAGPAKTAAPMAQSTPGEDTTAPETLGGISPEYFSRLVAESVQRRGAVVDRDAPAPAPMAAPLSARGGHSSGQPSPAPATASPVVGPSGPTGGGRSGAAPRSSEFGGGRSGVSANDHSNAVGGHNYGSMTTNHNTYNVNYGSVGGSQGGGSMPGGRGGGMPSHATGGGESPSRSAPVRGKAGILGTLAYAATNSTLNGRSVNGAVHEATGKHIEYHDASGARLGDSKTDAEKHAREHHAAGMARSSARYDEATRVNTGKKAPKLVP